MKKYIILIGFFLVLFSFILSGCIDNYIQGTGKIQYNDFEGGFYGIIGDNGENYDPINLPIEFKIDGIQVRYTLNILENQTSIHMWGTMVEIIEIERIS